MQSYIFPEQTCNKLEQSGTYLHMLSILTVTIQDKEKKKLNHTLTKTGLLVQKSLCRLGSIQKDTAA